MGCRMRPCRILVAEDDAASREMLTAFLKLQGHIVLAAADGADAMAVASRFQPDVVITDICMPGLSGVDLCRQLHHDPKTRHVPVLAMTALSVDEREDVMEVGFEDVLAKPIEFDQLEQRVAAAY